MKYVGDNSFNLSLILHLFNKYLFSDYFFLGIGNKIVKMSGKAENMKASEQTVKIICLLCLANTF